MTKKIKDLCIAKKIIFVYVLSLYINPASFSIDLGILHLSIGRILQPIIAIMCLYKIVKPSFKKHWKIPLCSNTYYLCFFAFWMLYAILSFLWVHDYYAWLRSSYSLFSGIITIFALSFYLDSLDDIKRLIYISIAMIFLHALIGYYEIKTGIYLFLSDPVRAEIYIRNGLPVSSMHNVNDFATVMLIGIYFSMALYLTTLKKIAKTVLSMTFLLLLTITCLSGSRAVLWGIFFSVMLYGLLYSTVRKKLLLGVPIIVFLSIIAIVIIPNVRDIFMKYYSATFTLDFRNVDSSDSIRYNLIINGLVYLMNTLCMGTGIGNIEYYMQHYSLLYTRNILNMHNMWIEILTSCGIFIFAGYCVFYWRLCRSMYTLSMHSNAKEIRGIAFAFLGFLIAFTIACISSSSLLSNNIMYLCFAIIIAFEHIAITQKYNKIMEMK